MMRRQLRYGEHATLWLDLPADSVLGDYSEPRQEPLEDPTAAVIAAVEQPLDFPPLSQATFRGDRVVIALDRQIPQVASVVAGIVTVLTRENTRAEDVRIVCATAAECLRKVAAAVADQIEVHVHDPHDPGALMYLAASKDSRPIYFNRLICEADVVIPVGQMLLPGTFAYFGTQSALYPTFSDAATQQRFRDRLSRARHDSVRQRRREVEEAAWLLGALFTIQVAPGPGDSILHVLAGEAHAVAREGRRLCEQAWLCRTPNRASLVVATIEGDQSQQTWENFARALFTASRAVSDEGAIVLCTELREQPGPAMRKLAAQAQDELDEDRPERLPPHAPDVLLADLVRKLRRRTRVYLLSDLDEEFVQGLGLGYVSDPTEIGTLSRRHPSCILLGNAHHALLAPESE